MRYSPPCFQAALYKLALITLFATLSFQASASHALVVGRKVWAAYDSTSSSPYLKYYFEITLLSDTTGIQPPLTLTLREAGSSSVLNLARISTRYSYPATRVCVNGSSNLKPLRIDVYRGSTYASINTDFYYYTNCCRPPGITNLASSAAYDMNFWFTFLRDYNLTGTFDPDQDGEFKALQIRVEDVYASICVSGNSFKFPALRKNPSDSLYIRRIDLNDTLPFSPGSGLYANGYSSNYPLGSDGTAQLNAKTGEETIDLQQAGTYLFSYEAELWKLNKTGTYSLFSTEHFQRIVEAVSNCSTPNHLDSLKLSIDNSALPQTAACDSNILKLNAPPSLDISSLARDGSDFSILDSAGNLVPIFRAEYRAVDSIRGQIRLLHDPFRSNGTYQLVPRVGNDLNTLTTLCGYALSTGDSLSFEVLDCRPNQGLGRTEEQVLKDYQLYPNPSDRGVVFYDFPQTAKLSIYSASGQLIKVYQTESVSGSISTEEFPAGLYLVHIETHGELRQIKLLLN